MTNEEFQSLRVGDFVLSGLGNRFEITKVVHFKDSSMRRAEMQEVGVRFCGIFCLTPKNHHNWTIIKRANND